MSSCRKGTWGRILTASEHPAYQCSCANMHSALTLRRRVCPLKLPCISTSPQNAHICVLIRVLCGQVCRMCSSASALPAQTPANGKACRCDGRLGLTKVTAQTQIRVTSTHYEAGLRRKVKTCRKSRSESHFRVAESWPTDAGPRRDPVIY